MRRIPDGPGSLLKLPCASAPVTELGASHAPKEGRLGPWSRKAGAHHQPSRDARQNPGLWSVERYDQVQL